MIRKIELNDIESVVQIYNYYITHTAVSFEEVPVSIDEMQTRVNKILSAGFPWFIAEQDGEVIGYAYACQWNVRSAYKHSAEVTIYLSHLNISKGWGTRLYNALFTALKERSIHVVIGGISLPNPASVALHEKFGMVKVAHFKKVGYKYEQWLDVGYWQGELESFSASRTK